LHAPVNPAAPFLLFAILAVTGAIGAAVMSALLADEAARPSPLDAALAFGIPIGLLIGVLPGWLLSAFLPISMTRGVLPLGAAALLCTALLLRKQLLRLARAWQDLIPPFLLCLALFVLFLWLRFPLGEARQTEKPMDFAVLNALMTTPSLPLQDPWMAGERFSYYYFGTLLLALPARASGLVPEVAYNFLAALLASLVGGAAWGAIRLRGGGPRLALLGSLLLVLGGTFDGARQFLGGVSLSGIDFWASSRRVEHAITEWPLFTLRLGDLHPHAVALPLLVLLAGVAGRFRGTRGLLLDAAILGALVSANPWDLPAALLILGAGDLAHRRLGAALRRSVTTLAAALLFLAPFLLSPRPPFLGLAKSPLGTTSPEAFLHFGVLLAVPALALGIALVRSRPSSDEAFLLGTLFPAIGIALAIVTGRPVLGLGLAFCLGVVTLVHRTSGALRAGLLLAACGAVLVALPDAVVMLDTYGEEFRRMNTLFKCWAGAAPLLALSSALLLPLVLSTRRGRFTIRTILVGALAASLVHPVAALAQRAAAAGGTLDALAFMTPGDRKAVLWLRNHAAKDDFLAEAPGTSYDQHARIGTASGRPTLLGWSAHEGVWRGEKGRTEIDARMRDLKLLFTSPDPRLAAEILNRRRVRFVVVGPLERADFGPHAFPAAAGFSKVFEADGTALYRSR
jgi:YYY domain-containing protein